MEKIEAKVILNNKKFTLISVLIIVVLPILLLFTFMHLKTYLNLNAIFFVLIILGSTVFLYNYTEKKMTTKAVINFDTKKIEFKIYDKETLSDEFSFNYNEIASLKVIDSLKSNDYFLKIVKTDKTSYFFRFLKPEITYLKDLTTKYILEYNLSTEMNKIEFKY